MSGTNRKGVLKPILCAAVLAASAALASAELAPPSGQYGIELEVQRSEDGATYVCTALIRDLATDGVVAAPRIQAPMGEEVRATSGFEVEGVRYELELSVALEGDAFTYRFEAKHGGTVATAQAGTLRPWNGPG